MPMTHRERVLAALEFREPDRVPIDLGTARFTSMVVAAYERLRAHLGFGEPGPIVDRMQQLVQVDERILQHLGADLRAFSQGAADSGADTELPDGRYRDEWGVTRRKPPGCHYYELDASPLAGPLDATKIARYPWPDPTDPGITRGLREKALALRAYGYAVMYNARFNLVHTTQYLRGFEDWFYDLGGDHDLFRCLMDAVTDILVALNHRTLTEVGDLIDVVAFGDDIGQQDREVCSVAMYRKLIRPYQERVIETIRKHTHAKIMYHTCGSVWRYIPDFIDLGINALNPVQIRARSMDPVALKREFGGRIAFWGGIDTQRILPHGSPDEVRAEVRRIFDILGPGGGYVVASVHNIQPDVPPENVVAMFEAARECRYAQRAAV
ncbi:MAG TPA: uroporphyrinogen decarboxylase family protein [Bryobacteraceae bacterium]|nr:uroporphyrinogen decarboxylase family protein [Bryobacteraceae bacterium]